MAATSSFRSIYSTTPLVILALLAMGDLEIVFTRFQGRWFRHLLAYFAAVILICGLFTRTAHAAPHLELVHLERSLPAIKPSGDQATWLRQHGQRIRVGIVPNGMVPFDLVDSGRWYVGITADYLDMLRSTTGSGIDLHEYANQSEMFKGLRNGEIDMVTTVYLAKARNTNKGRLLLSESYFPARNAVVERSDSSSYELSESGKNRIAYMPSVVSKTWMEKAYGSSNIVPTDSTEQGIKDVAFGRADRFVGNVTECIFLINRLQLSNLRIRYLVPAPITGFRFAFATDSAPLRNLTNRVISLADADLIEDIRLRWEGRPTYVALNPLISFTEQERRWSLNHPIIYYDVSREVLPFLFRDQEGRLSGLTVDMLGYIGRQIGVTFKPVNGRDPSLNPSIVIIEPLVGAQMVHDGYISTYPYFWGGFALVGRNAYQGRCTLEALRGCSIAVPEDLPKKISAQLMSAGASLISLSTEYNALRSLNDKKSDIAIVNMASARYLIEQDFYRKLVIINTLNYSDLMQIRFGIPKSSPELASMLTKVLHGTREVELNNIRDNWHTAILPGSAFRRVRHYYHLIVTAVAMVASIFLVFGIILAYHVNRRRRAETVLKDQIALQTTLLDSMPAPVMRWDLECRLRDCNQAFKEVAGENQKPVGLTIGEIGVFSEDNAGWISDLFNEALREKSQKFADERLQLLGRQIDVRFWVVPFYSHRGQLAGLLSGWADVTERGNLQRSLQDARDNAVRANQAKSEFLAMMSHEVRTPMNAILGVLELRKEQNLVDGQDLSAAYESARALLSIIDQILDFSKIEAGKLVLLNEPTDVCALASSVAAIFRPLAHKNNISLFENIAPTPGKLIADPVRLRQVIGNLLSNAIKFTQRGSVTLRVSIQQTDGETTSVLIEVADTGIGIGPKSLSQIIEPFFQADASIASNYGGTGLGLSICHRLVELMGGKLTIDSHEGLGTVIQVALTLSQADENGDSQVDQINVEEWSGAGYFNGRRALVVDDNSANRIVLSRQLQFLGFETICCESGDQAVDVWQRERIDVLITDCYMPGLTGYDLARRIRQCEALNEYRREVTVIVGYTANIQPDMLDLARESGMNACHLKPLDLHCLATALYDALAPRGGTSDKLEQCNETRGKEILLHDSMWLAVRQLGDPILECEVLEAALSTSSVELDRLRTAIEGCDLETIRQAAHLLITVASMAGATQAQDLCRMTERMATEGNSEEALNAAMSVLDKLGEVNQLLESRMHELRGG
ncbi:MULTISPECIES: ATP-binding protein [Burkholderia]|uniref:ATP-binding protein n=1 Tax=Burkholderia TaxID=32008 RepID=UPI0009EC29F6|nr:MULTISPECIES: ATP-binding protein [Burkholderia]